MTTPRTGTCAVCRLRGRITRVEVNEETRIAIGPAGLYACAEHRAPLELGVEATSAAVRAGVTTLIERKAPGATEKLQGVWRTITDVVRSTR